MQRGGKPRADDLDDTRRFVERAAEIAGGKVDEKDSVLCCERPIKPQALPQCFLVRRCGGLPEHDFHGIARDQMNENEDERYGPEQGGHEQQQPPK